MLRELRWFWRSIAYGLAVVAEVIQIGLAVIMLMLVLWGAGHSMFR